MQGPPFAVRPAQSCFVVFVPQAESLVSDLRTQFDDSARLGVSAHITALFPFMPPERIDSAVLQRCAKVLNTHASFEFQLSSVERFPVTAFLEPNPSAPFTAPASVSSRVESASGSQ
jgi:hypothetical protein